MNAYFQGIKSDVRTSSGMFLNAEERKYPMVQVSLPSSLLNNFCVYNVNPQLMYKLLWKIPNASFSLLKCHAMFVHIMAVALLL